MRTGALFLCLVCSVAMASPTPSTRAKQQQPKLSGVRKAFASAFISAALLGGGAHAEITLPAHAMYEQVDAIGAKQLDLKMPATDLEAQDMLRRYYELPLPEITQRLSGASEEQLRRVFNQARECVKALPLHVINTYINKILAALPAKQRANLVKEYGTADEDVFSSWMKTDADRAAAKSLVGELDRGVRELQLNVGLNFTGMPSSLADVNSLSLTEVEAEEAKGGQSLGRDIGLRTRKILLAQHAGVAKIGWGPYYPSRPGHVEAGAQRLDCTQFIFDVMSQAFAKAGQSALWDRVLANTLSKSPDHKFRGTEFQRALVEEAHWKGVFWSPDTTSTDHNGEHAASYRIAQKTGKYYNVPVDFKDSVVDYNHDVDGGDHRAPNPVGQERLRELMKLPFAVITVRGGEHMALLINGQLYEGHWDGDSSNADIMTRIDFDKWSWQSGVAVFPVGK